MTACEDRMRRVFHLSMWLLGVTLTLSLLRSQDISAQNCKAAHDVGQMVLLVTNWGEIGGADQWPFYDCFTGKYVPTLQYPKGSRTRYLFDGNLWVGGVVGRDTLVSVQFVPDPGAPMVQRSTTKENLPNPELAVSEQDYISRFLDPFAYSALTWVPGRPYPSLPLEITQRSFGWSYEYTEDFVIFEVNVRNVGDRVIDDAYIGFYMDPNVHLDKRTFISGGVDVRATDDYVGYLLDYPAEYVEQCQYMDTLRLAWAADNNGDPIAAGFEVPDVTGLRSLGILAREKQVSFNWWITNYDATIDFGPQLWQNLRPLGNGLGTPTNDRERYFLMSNGEQDYDQMFIGDIFYGSPWQEPPPGARQTLFKGGDGRYVLSVGPFTLIPGATVTVPFAVVGGRNFHTDPTNYTANIDRRYAPVSYRNELSFSDLARNALWADWVYDNPGVDTDSDFYAGPMRICVLDSILQGGHWVPTDAETIYSAGDGQADLSGAASPVAPYVWITREPYGLRLRINGQRTENMRDIFTREKDFEGYRVYLGLDDRYDSFSLIASYDRENYDRFVYNPAGRPRAGFELFGKPLELEELRCLYGTGIDPCMDTLFDPLQYSPTDPYVHPHYPESLLYFQPHDYNADRFGVETKIRRRFPDQPPPSSLSVPLPEELTDDGYLKYYEYEILIDNLLPTVPYYVAVTAFDTGSPKGDVPPLESSRTGGAIRAFPETEFAGTPEGQGVYLYPNPYRIDERYRQNWWEGRAEEDKAANRVRAIHFENLPPRCTIRIYSLDGDLIRELPHDVDPADPTSSHDYWDLITRNTQLIVSGIYYWTVEDETGQVQMGKFVIIM